MQPLSSFDPTQFNFILLRDFWIPGNVSVYELHNHPSVDGKKDFLRLNLYLTRDSNYVTIWKGLLDVFGTEAEFESGRMASVKLPDDFDFRDYNEDLFRGHIDSHETAVHIFKALRVGEGDAHALPQVLTAGPDRKLRCDCMRGAG
jgi:hypothetical protein